MSQVSLRVNVPVQLGVLDFSDTITVSSEIIRTADGIVQSDITDYELFKGGAIIPDVGTKMAQFAETTISNTVSSAIRIKPDSPITSVKIQVAENANTEAINEALQSALANLPAVQPNIVQIVLTFVLATEPIETEDYIYDGQLSWTLAVNYIKPLNTANLNMGGFINSFSTK